MAMNFNEPFNREGLVKSVRESIVGQDQLIGGPFGERKIIYCDWVASGRAIGFLEDYIRSEVLPAYSNTHTTSSTLGHQTSLFREEARTIIARTINARDDKDAVIFAGTGATGAVHHLLGSMRLNMHQEYYDANPEKRPVVFVGPHEHHSNILPWRESACEVVMIGEDEQSGLIDMNDLEAKLNHYQSRPLKIGTFSAASNITGILQETAEVNKMMHKHGGLAFWDFAAAAPYVKIDVNPMAAKDEDRGMVHMDALFMSPHKFPGGVCTPGILVAKKKLFDRSLPPCFPGGGTVEFVTNEDQVYRSKIHEREEAGTPDIVGCIRAGLVFQLKHNVTPDLIETIEHKIFIKAITRLSKNPRIQIMGPLTKPAAPQPSGGSVAVPRLSILSFLIYHQSGKLLHYNFVCAMLDNLFGIQSRGGCVCAGPYGLNLLGMDLPLARLYEEQLVKYDDVEVLRPGFIRLAFNYFADEKEVDFVLDAVDFIANEGWKLLPEYSFQPETSEWIHLSNKSLPNRKWLGEISYKSGKMEFPSRVNQKIASSNDLPSYIQQAKTIVDDYVKQLSLDQRMEELSLEHEMMREDAEELRWFVYPEEAFLKKIDIEDEDERNPGTKQNYHNEQWRNKWLDFCPFVPKYYNFDQSAFLSTPLSFYSSSVDISSNSSTATNLIMPKTHRFTATVTSLESAIAKPQSPPTVQVVEKVSSIDKTNQPPNGMSSIKGTVTKENYEPISSLSTASEKVTYNLEDALYTDEDEGLTSTKHTHNEEEDGDDPMEPEFFVCPIPSASSSSNNGSTSSSSSSTSSPCGVPSNSKSSSERSSVKSLIEQRKKSGKKYLSEAKLQQNAKDTANMREVSINRKLNRQDKYDPVDQIEHRLFKQMVSAIRLFDLIGEGDRVLVGVSGGKDSLSLLHLLLKAQKFLPFKFEVAAVTIDPQTLEFDPSPLKVYMAEIGVKYFYDSQPLISIAGDIGPSSICAWCSRMKRGILHNVCEREGYNVLALGQHLDDCVESFLMYGFHNGKLDTMKAATVLREGRLKVVRPFVFVRERDTKHYATLKNFPVITENCPACFEEPKERARVKALLKAQERLYPNLFGNLLKALKPLMHPDLHLDEILTKLDNDSKNSRNQKYYPKRRSDEEAADWKIQKEAMKKAKKEKIAWEKQRAEENKQKRLQDEQQKQQPTQQEPNGIESIPSDPKASSTQ